MAGDLPSRLIKSTKQVVSNAVIQAGTNALLGKPGVNNLDINNYISRFLGANARAYLFLYRPSFPSVSGLGIPGRDTPFKIPSAVTDIATGMGGKIAAVTQTATKMVNTIYGSPIGTPDFMYFVKSTTLPEISVEETSVHWIGQQFKMANTRRSQDWSVDFYVDNDANIVNQFWLWNKSLHDPKTNKYKYRYPKEYMADQKIQLLGLNGDPILTYTLFGAWPKSIGAIDLDYATNEFAYFTLNFTYQYIDIEQTDASGLQTSGLRNVVQNAISKLIR